ncbi:type IV pilus assembly protein FimV [Sulfuriroseicoccus oceanibius]|uniref:Uncharacterized protein n=1 Tax=Sulfuriroseicoccus oceanibius TaxID=2707525 RepID=A0A6B3LG31_9BACT|nr:hypothetical protein [Sulfuriroseicoccus oceanibius]QQL45422.1 hypothetical protein G3M56_002185 [Sulfuriroseicoccus oceanibius]
MNLFPTCALLMVTAFTLNAQEPVSSDPPTEPEAPTTPADPTPADPTPADPAPASESPAPTEELELPEHPGFSWWRIPELKGAILVPEGWHTKAHPSDESLAYFITKSEIDDDNPSFDTGLSLNVFLKAKETLGKDALKWATDYRRTAASKGKVLESWEKARGPFKSLGLRLRVSDAEGGIVMHHLFVINPKTDTLYFYFFEAPEKQWPAAWKKGELMMKTLLIDDEV